MSREAQQRALHEVLMGGKKSNVLASEWKVLPERMTIYAEFVRGHLEEILEKNYPALQRVCSDKLWKKMRDCFFKEAPASHFELNACAFPFPEWLEEKVNTWPELTAAHVQLAILERAESVAYFALNTMLSQKDLELEPTLQVFQCDFKLSAYLNQEHDLSWPPEKTGSIVFIWRAHQDLLVRHLEVTSQELLVFKMVHDSISLQEASALSGVAFECLADYLESAKALGWVC